ncbi:unnamed protein product [Citrullus colocynthis]|uniref:Secreted protein n=1 Tax=Citrullus colocynthis TaxID=252529 RepID=A0ABP0ZB13_9ROSI
MHFFLMLLFKLQLLVLFLSFVFPSNEYRSYTVDDSKECNYLLIFIMLPLQNSNICFSLQSIKIERETPAIQALWLTTLCHSALQPALAEPIRWCDKPLCRAKQSSFFFHLFLLKHTHSL